MGFTGVHRKLFAAEKSNQKLLNKTAKPSNTLAPPALCCTELELKRIQTKLLILKSSSVCPKNMICTPCASNNTSLSS